jgi:multidrug resistance efflux pump
VQIDDAALAAARAEVDRIRVEIDRRTIRAPVAGRVLQINIRPGEFAESGVLTTPLMVLGDDVRLRLRVDIDENDAGRVDPSARAVAVVRGRPELRTDLRFESIEPYVAPKKSLTGDTTERVDTRVLQVIYSFERATLPVYVGQRLDVFIQAPATGPQR